MGLRIDPSVFPPAGLEETAAPDERRTIVLGAGLFWCADALYRQLTGVVSVRPGYSGGTQAEASFEAVAAGVTGHTFVVEVVYGPAQVSLGRLLQIFFSIAHDPTARDRPGSIGANACRSVIYHTTAAQRTTALDYIRRLQQAGVFDSLIRTEVSPLMSFFEAEAVHHDYVANHPREHHARLITLPKLNKLKKLHGPLLKA